MAASSIQLAVTAYSGNATLASTEQVHPRPESESETHTTEEAVKISVATEVVEERAPEEVAQDERKSAERKAEKLQTTLNSGTTLKFEVQLFGDTPAPGAISAFRFQVVDKETGKVVRQFPPSEMLKMTQQPEGLYVNASI